MLKGFRYHNRKATLSDISSISRLYSKNDEGAFQTWRFVIVVFPYLTHLLLLDQKIKVLYEGNG